jgi:segregation and condensation protein B
MTETELKPIIEALIYVAEEPITETTLLTLLGSEHKDNIRAVITSLIEQYRNSEHGIEIKEIANGYKMATKAEHHEWVRKYVRHQTPPTKLSLAALETLAVIAYKQPVTVPEIQEVRGVNAVGVLKTLIDKGLITTAGRKSVIGRPILYKTTKEFLVQFGLKNLDELPSLDEFEELTQSALADSLPDAFGLAQAETTPQESLTGSTSEGAPLDETESVR